MAEIWFWQRIVSPHMVGLASALAHKGVDVVYVAERFMSVERADQGWAASADPRIRLVIPESRASLRRMAELAPGDCDHFCQGLRGNGYIGIAECILARRGANVWIIMESVEDGGWTGVLKRAAYDWLVPRRRRALRGVLAIGQRTSEWVVARGMPSELVYRFAYFLPGRSTKLADGRRVGALGRIRFLFVGRLIKLKRVDLLIDALSRLQSRQFELGVVGSGPLEQALRERCNERLGGRVRWIGRLPVNQVASEMECADCLVLPSYYDGWGAVISESLIVGTPVICSDRCGAAEVVSASGAGSVFQHDNMGSLVDALTKRLECGRVKDRDRLKVAAWAVSLTAEAGAEYLIEIVNHRNRGGVRPVAPWLRRLLKGSHDTTEEEHGE